MSRSKAKGTAAETAVVRFLRTAGFAQAERRTLSGAQDRGDIAGIPGVVIEVKNCARQELPAWVAEAEIERDNDHASLGVVWHKRRGKADPADWFVTMSGAQFAQLLREHQGLPAPANQIEIADLRAELDHWRPDGKDGYGTPVHWTVYNEMHKRALTAEAEGKRLRADRATVLREAAAAIARDYGAAAVRLRRLAEDAQQDGAAA